jgi:hypothetical protein
MTPDKLLRPRSVGKLLDCTTRHVYDLIQTGRLEGRNINGGGRGDLRISVESLLSFIERNSFRGKRDGE